MTIRTSGSRARTFLYRVRAYVRAKGGKADKKTTSGFSFTICSNISTVVPRELHCVSCPLRSSSCANIGSIGKGPGSKAELLERAGTPLRDACHLRYRVLQIAERAKILCHISDQCPIFKLLGRLPGHRFS